MKKQAIFLLLLLAVILPVQGQSPPDTRTAAKKAYFGSGKEIFPCRWRNNRIEPAATALDKSEYQRHITIAGRALSKYPEKLVRKNLRKIHFVKTLMFFGLEYGGTYFKRNVYISSNGVERGYTDQFVEGTFHHEFSSVLLKRKDRHFDRQAWEKANPEGFRYGEGGLEALRNNNTSLIPDTSLFGQGFLNEYSLASFEEDFNCFAEFLFMADEVFWQAWSNHEAIRQKTEILIRFYQKLDPVYTITYFREL